MMNTTTTTTSYGLCAGRHALPVEDYIFHEIHNPADIAGIEEKAAKFVAGLPRHQPVDIYVTGLTVALTAVIKFAARREIPLTLWHYDRESGGYVPQYLDLYPDTAFR